MSPRPALFELSNLSKAYGGERELALVFENLWYRAPACAVLGIVGPSGGGKTTLLNLIGGIDTPTLGSVRVLGERVPFEDAAALLQHRAGVGFVFQSSNLVSHLRARENVAMPLLLRGVARRFALREAERRLDELGLASLARRRPHELSGGQQQRVAIARALASGARLVLADEPTSALDADAAQQVLAALRAAADEHGCGVLVVSHDPAVASACDEVVRCAAGVLSPLVPHAHGAL